MKTNATFAEKKLYADAYFKGTPLYNTTHIGNIALSATIKNFFSIVSHVCLHSYPS